MNSAGGARITFEGKDSAVSGFDEIESDLTGNGFRFDECSYPLENFRMVDVLKCNRRALTGSEVGAIGRVRGDVSVVADAVRAELLSLDEFLRDPRIIGIKCQRGKGLF